MQVESTRMYRVKDVAQHFDVSVTTIYRAIESGQLDALKLGTGNGTLRVTGAAVTAYAHACTQTTTDPSITAATPSATTDQDPTVPPDRARTTRSARAHPQHPQRNHTIGETLTQTANETTRQDRNQEEGGHNHGSTQEHPAESRL